VTNHIDHSHHGIDPRPSLSALRKEKPYVPVFLIVILGVVAIVTAFFVAHPFVRLGLLVFGSAVVLFALLVIAYKFLQTRKTSYATQALISLISNDASPCFLADLEGRVSFRNDAATDRFRERAV
jgi:two-component system cell cycle sensor histidine kinase/response regulator CckA